jgi:hypothetical protein
LDASLEVVISTENTPLFRMQDTTYEIDSIEVGNNGLVDNRVILKTWNR